MPREPDPVEPFGDYDQVFLVGSPRSGTSWVDRILRAHPQTTGAGESHVYPQLWRPLVSGGCRRFGLTDRILETIQRNRDRSPHAGVHCYATDDELREILRDVRVKAFREPWTPDAALASYAVKRVLAAHYLLAQDGSLRMLVEKTPAHAVQARRILSDFPRAKVIHVLRDGRDVCVSLQMLGLKQSWPPKTRLGQIRMWRRHVEAMDKVSSDPAIRNRITTVRYEDLHASPLEETKRLFDFVGLKTSPELLEKVLAENDFARYRVTGDGEYNRRGEIGDWREHFSALDRALFRRLAGGLSQRVGYTLED